MEVVINGNHTEAERDNICQLRPPPQKKIRESLVSLHVK